MKTQSVESKLRFEESRTLKWFIVLFYIISISYDFFYQIISIFNPNLKYDKTEDVLEIWIYVFMFALIPVAIYLFKKQKQHQIKYIYFISYTFLTLVCDIVTYIGQPALYKSGNVVELFWLLLSPVFVNAAFVKVVSAGLVLKYIISGLIIKTPVVLLGILLIMILSIFSFIILYRFQSYVNSIRSSYDQQLEGIVKGIIATLELKDPYTRGHSERVANYALELAKKCGRFSAEELKDFNYACLLHDIGKIHIPDHILTKPGRLTKEEYEIIKLHPVVGAEVISKVVGFENSIEVIRSHHERWDGKGYPDQLKGEEIPYLARITAIADAFDAMTSTRSYRAALTVEEAYSRILEGKNLQFDPELVKGFQEIFPLWRDIHQRAAHEQQFEDLGMNQAYFDRR